VSLAKSVSPSSAKPGEAITYTLAINNSGAITATNIVLTDIVPANVSVTGIVSAGVSITQAAGVSYAWQIQDLLPNQDGVITITGWLAKPLAAGTIPNTATLSVSGTVQSASAPLTVQNVEPVANAGLDQSRSVSSTVTLNGSGSTDDNGDALTYGWKQTGGPAVTFTPNLSITTFTAPGTPTVLTFTLTVTDTSSLTGTDEVVVVTVRLFCAHGQQGGHGVGRGDRGVWKWRRPAAWDSAVARADHEQCARHGHHAHGCPQHHVLLCRVERRGQRRGQPRHRDDGRG